MRLNFLVINNCRLSLNLHWFTANSLEK